MRIVVNALEAYLATRRITSLMVEDRITEPVREAIWGRFDGDSTMVGYVFTCRKCSSVWAGLGVVALTAIPGGRIITRALAFSEASIMTDDLLPPVMEL